MQLSPVCVAHLRALCARGYLRHPLPFSLRIMLDASGFAMVSIVCDPSSPTMGNSADRLSDWFLPVRPEESLGDALRAIADVVETACIGHEDFGPLYRRRPPPVD
jgi:hypothetical protein